jgi:3-isopropylmalate/(R)-2-methylmalate dehydratase small subunit
MQRAEEKPETKVIVDLESQTVGIEGEEWTMHFDIDAHVKHMLVNGLDDISLTLQSVDDITAYEAKRPSFLPTTVA